ncbi:TPA: hypothetical protein DCY43_01445 [candidate division WWE3 bacterium]|uniref:Uncharacterized protein n=3 Tax=Katanobacteria TaxID=422282 RepID=A0A0G1KIU2_UNCKA|nr:MAG: hypothetical protein UW36_C0007G0041 [candidate division WWE3 bacterium GW2011_GWA2_44_16]KKT83455.1 MAG: hypothetical protein UW82_C0039G0005 [candidate division WWE3 bacterium GW2011_GWC2_44_9]HAZ29404.1 hypothetical protein [candidate division WWE3 bacterium]
MDQTNGIVLPVRDVKIVDGIKCFNLGVDEEDTETAFKVPFRLVPVSSIYYGIRALVSNLDPLIEQATREEPNPEAVELIQKFGVGTQRVFGAYAFKKLVPPEWRIKRMRNQPEWIQETEGSSARIKSGN